MADDAKGLTARIESLSPRGLWWTALLLSAAAVLVVSGLVALTLQRSRFWVSWQPVLLAVAAVVVVPAVGLWPLSSSDPSDNKRIARAAYTGTPIRLATVGVLALIVLLNIADKSERIAFGLWLAGLYLVSLLVETIVLAVWLRGRSA